MSLSLDCLGLSVAQASGHALRPLHTQAKSRDHGIVGVQKKVFKSHPKTPPKSCRCGQV
jgi:hypothetical protein